MAPLAKGMSMTDWLGDRYDLAVQLAVEAGQLTLEFFRTRTEVQRKQDGSPVTMADREAERLMRERVQTAFPPRRFLAKSSARMTEPARSAGSSTRSMAPSRSSVVCLFMGP